MTHQYKQLGLVLSIAHLLPWNHIMVLLWWRQFNTLEIKWLKWATNRCPTADTTEAMTSSLTFWPDLYLLNLLPRHTLRLSLSSIHCSSLYGYVPCGKTGGNTITFIGIAFCVDVTQQCFFGGFFYTFSPGKNVWMSALCVILWLQVEGLR